MLLLNLLFLLLANAVSRREKSILYNRVAIIILLYCSMTALENLSIKDYGRGISIYGGLYQITGITESFEIFVYIVGAIILQLTGFYPYLQKMIKGNKLISKDDETYRHIEYPLIILFILLGGIFLMTSSDIVTMYLAIELQSYGLYILVTLNRDSEWSTSSGLTYFLLGGLSSCFICVPGRFQSYSNQTICFDCPSGFFSSQVFVSLSSLLCTA